MQQATEFNSMAFYYARWLCVYFGRRDFTRHVTCKLVFYYR